MTTSSKTVYIAMGSVAGACVLALVGVLIWMYTGRIDSYTITSATTKEGTPATAPISQSQCGAAPSVDPVTGAVSNYQNTVMPDGKTCGENPSALNAVCLASRCTDATLCPAPNASWDAYVTGGHACIKVTKPTCEQQACDAPYCTSASVVAALPPQHKMSINTGGTVSCENVPESTVASMCNNLDDRVYVFPDCRPAATKKTILTRTTTAQTGLVEGLLSFPPDNAAYQEMQFTYKLSTLNGSTSGTVSVRPDIGCDVDTDVCLRFTIYPQPGLRAGSYDLTVFATPLWTTVPLLQSAQPEAIQMTVSPSSSTVKPQLNPKPDVATATNTMMSYPDWFRNALAVLANKEQYSDLNIVVPTSTCGAPTTGCAVSISDMIRITPEPSNAPLLLFAATPSFIPLENNKVMPYQFLVMAWPQVDDAVRAAACPASPTDPIYYDVTRTRTNGVGSAEPLLTRSGYPELLDIVRVGDSWNYTLYAYQGSNYADSKCRSEPVTVTVNVKPFDDQTCHQVVPPSTVSGNPLPPWMWATPQGCQWDTSNLGAQDYYCAFEYNKDLSDIKFDPTELHLFEQGGSNQCGAVRASYPTLTRSWPTSFANCKGNTTCESQACFTGYADPEQRVAVCDAELDVGTSAAKISNGASFVQRLSNLMNFYNHHNVHPELDAQVATIQDAAAQANLYNNFYYNCGPATDAEKWGIDPTLCTPYDAGACQQAFEQGHCDINMCNAWKYASTNGPLTYYSQTRTTFTDPAVAATTCCPEDYTYKFNKDALPGVPRGECELTQ